MKYRCGIAMVGPAIRAERLSRDFGDRRVVDNLSFEVDAGTVFGFLGPNGAGKTTTIRLLLGLLEPSAGRAEVLGYDTRTEAPEIRGRAGALLEHAGLYELHTALENLDFYGRITRLPGPERRARIEELLRWFELWDRRHDRVWRWSRGMKQRLAIARAILHRPPVVFLDEPTAGLDPAAAAALRAQIAELAAADGTTIFLTTHNLAEAEQVCARLAIIDRGRLLALGSPAELRMRASAPRVEIIGRNFSEQALALLRARVEVRAASTRPDGLLLELRETTRVAPLIALIVAQGGEIEEVRKPAASLEEVYLSVMGAPA
jgi:ABC-2 type transport system ATP-binding protein